MGWSKLPDYDQRLGPLVIERDQGAEAAQGLPSRRSFLTGSAALLAGGALLAAPRAAEAHTTADPPTDIDILNYALTLEHLEYAFYRDGLEVFGAKDIKSSDFLKGAGKRFLRRQAYRYLQLIRDHEDTHVDTLMSVISSLGGTPVPEATYNF